MTIRHSGITRDIRLPGRKSRQQLWPLESRNLWPGLNLTALTSMAISKSRLRAELGVCCNFATASKLFSSEHDLKLFYCRPNVGSAQLFNMGDNHAQVIPNGRSTVGASGNLDDRECR
jgi:hypothetical protein